MKDTSPPSEFKLFHDSLRGMTVTDLFNKEVPKYILWDKIKDNSQEIALAKIYKHPDFNFTKKC
jgi:hypothetical protein